MRKTYKEKTSANYNKWVVANRLLNLLRKARGVELVPASANPYRVNKGGVKNV